MIKNLSSYDIKRNIRYSVNDLIEFETNVVNLWEQSKIFGPVHLSNGNEYELIEIFKRISSTDWVFSTWRSHYHALLKGIPKNDVFKKIADGKSISICDVYHKFYSSAIVGSILPIALGVALSNKISNRTDEKVWCFIGDMAFETGIFYEVHKYARNFNLPLHFVVEDNGLSTNTPTEITWNAKRDIPDDVIYYEYKSKYPHYGTGKWLIF